MLHTHRANDRRGPIQEETVSTAVATEISMDVVVAAVLSKLNDIITFEREQMASLEGFSWVEKTHCGAKASQGSRPVAKSFNQKRKTSFICCSLTFLIVFHCLSLWMDMQNNSGRFEKNSTWNVR